MFGLVTSTDIASLAFCSQLSVPHPDQAAPAVAMDVLDQTWLSRAVIAWAAEVGPGCSMAPGAPRLDLARDKDARRACRSRTGR